MGTSSVILIIIAVVIFVILIALCYRKAPPTEALVISGLGHREPKVISGKGSVVLPIFQRVDKILMRIMKVDVKTPETGVKTIEGVPLWLDAVVTIQVYSESSTVTPHELASSGCKNRKEYILQRQQAAISNFLGYSEKDIAEKVNDILQGNLREIVATMNVMDLLTKRKEFAESVIENARPDLAKMGLEVVTFNIQDIQDAIDNCGSRHGVVEAIGVQREMEVKREAERARAEAERDINIAQADAARETAERKAEADRMTAEAQTKLELKRAELKAQADRARADAEAAGRIQEQIQEKTRKQAEADVAIAVQEKEIIRAEREAEVKQRELDAEVRKKADADRYQMQQKADAERYQQEKQSEAELIAAQKRAEGIRAIGLAEAEAIRAKSLAEAEGIARKAEAQLKMGEASKLEMLYNVMPDVAKALAGVLNGVDSVTLYGTDTASNLMSSMTQGLNQFMKAIGDGTGVSIDPNALAGAMIGSKLTEKAETKPEE